MITLAQLRKAILLGALGLLGVCEEGVACSPLHIPGAKVTVVYGGAQISGAQIIGQASRTCKSQTVTADKYTLLGSTSSVVVYDRDRTRQPCGERVTGSVLFFEGRDVGAKSCDKTFPVFAVLAYTDKNSQGQPVHYSVTFRGILERKFDSKGLDVPCCVQPELGAQCIFPSTSRCYSGELMQIDSNQQLPNPISLLIDNLAVADQVNHGNGNGNGNNFLPPARN